VDESGERWAQENTGNIDIGVSIATMGGNASPSVPIDD